MDDEVYVSCHAPCFSRLLFETARSVHDQKGLLIGKVHTEINTTTTDDNEADHVEKTAIYIQHCVPITDEKLFNNVGKVDKNVLQKYIELYPNKIIGWYSFRRNTTLQRTSLREKLIHSELSKCIPGVDSQLFVLALFTASISASLSTHTYHQLFFRSHHGDMEALRLKIYTLSDSCTNNAGYLVKSTFPTTEIFERIIEKFKSKDKPVEAVNSIQENCHEILNLYSQKLIEAEKQRSNLEKEVRQLRDLLGLTHKKEITLTNVEEPEPEEEEEEIKTIRYNPRKKYNPGRLKNPLDVELMFDSDSSQDINVDSPQSTDSNAHLLIDFDSEPAPPPQPVKSYSSALTSRSPCQTSLIDSDVWNKQPDFSTKTPKLREGLSPCYRKEESRCNKIERQKEKGRNEGIDNFLKHERSAASPELFSSQEDKHVNGPDV